MLSYCDYFKAITSLPDGLMSHRKSGLKQLFSISENCCHNYAHVLYSVDVPRKHQEFPKITPTCISVPEHVG